MTARVSVSKSTNKSRTRVKSRSNTLLGSLISVNIGPRTGSPRSSARRPGGGGWFSRLKAAGMRHVAALRGSDYTAARAHGGTGGFDRFREQRPDLFDPAPDHGEADGWNTGDGPRADAPDTDGGGGFDGGPDGDGSAGPWWRRWGR